VNARPPEPTGLTQVTAKLTPTVSRTSSPAVTVTVWGGVFVAQSSGESTDIVCAPGRTLMSLGIR